MVFGWLRAGQDLEREMNTATSIEERETLVWLTSKWGRPMPMALPAPAEKLMTECISCDGWTEVEVNAKGLTVVCDHCGSVYSVNRKSCITEAELNAR